MYTQPTTLSVDQYFSILQNDGVLLVPAVTGYLLMGATKVAVARIFEIKQRPVSKTIGLAATPAIYKALCASHFRTSMKMIKYPMGVIDYANATHPLVQALPDLAVKEGKLGFFFNAGTHIVTMAEYCYQKGMLLMITSANPSGEPIIQKLAQLPSAMLNAVDHVLEDDDFIAQNHRPFEPPHSTILDFTAQRILRVGIYANQISHRAFQLGMLKQADEHQEQLSPAKPPRSVMFLLSYKASSFDKIYHYERADWFVLDLEDSCPLHEKPVGRRNIEQFMQDGRPLEKPVFIRLNCQRDKANFEEDLSLAYTTKINGFLLPMIYGPEDIQYVADQLTAMEQSNQIPEGHFKLIPIIETAQALVQASAIATASERICALCWGHADFAADTRSVINETNKEHVRARVVWAAKAAGLIAIDTAFTNISDYEGLKREAALGRDQGFDAKYILHERHIDIVNEVFGIKRAQHDKVSALIDDYYRSGEGMFVHHSGVLLAPPFVKSMEHDLNRRIVEALPETFHTVTAVSLAKQEKPNFYVGQVLAPRNHMTIDEAWVSQWKTLSYNCQRIENDELFAHQLGFKQRPIPYQAMVHYGVAQVVDCFSSYSKYHLGILNGRQVRPAYCGDTFAVEMCITRMQPSSNGKYVVVESVINISNQNNEVVMQMGRRSLFDAFEMPETTVPIPDQFLKAPVSKEQYAIEQQILNVPPLENTLAKNKLQDISLIKHDVASVLDLSQSSAYCHFFRNVHPLHLNHIRYDEVAMSGGVVLPVVCAIVKTELGAVYREELIQTAHLNPVRDGDLVGAMSYIIRQEEIGTHTLELTLRTYGIRNLDVQNDLIDLPIPKELFLQNELKPSETERLLHLSCPKLSRKLVIRVDWKVQVGVR